VLHSGGVAGFPMPVLRYYVGYGGEMIGPGGEPDVTLLEPAEGAMVAAGAIPTFRWRERGQAPFYRLDVRNGSGALVFSAVIERGTGTYAAPSWFHEKVGTGRARWRVVPLTSEGEPLTPSPWRDLHAGVAQ
jgi:hypothetical protein